MLRFALVAALVASTVAFAPPKSAAVQPRKVNVNAPLAKALELRGGGIISKVRCAVELCVYHLLYRSAA